MKKLPENKDLPYFAYDAYKPGQFAFPVISYFVDYIEPFELDNPHYELKHRNGMPMIVEDESTSPIRGYLIHFNDNTVEKEVKKDNKTVIKELCAYDYIIKTKPSKLFKWEVGYNGGEPFNMTVGRKKDFGVPYNIYKGNFNARNDPTFFDILEYIDENIHYMEKNNQIRNNFECSCKLQMYYMLLWSSIDKYLTLCYGGSQNQCLKSWSESEEFRLGFRDVNRYHVVISTKDDKKYELIPGNTEKSIYYYYQLRCNIVHSGKKENTDVSFLLFSIKELLDVFYRVLDLSFHPERYEEYHLSDWRKLLDKTPIF